jgi:hypothetical protein
MEDQNPQEVAMNEIKYNQNQEEDEWLAFENMLGWRIVQKGLRALNMFDPNVIG